MDSKSTNEIEQNQENSKLKESANNNTVNSDETKISSPEKESNPKKEEKEEKEENKNKDNLDIKTPKSEEQKDNKKYEKELELIKELKKDNYKKLYLIRKYYDYRTREDKDWKFGIISRIDEDSLIIENIEKDKKSQIKIDDSFKLSYSRKYSEATEENHLKRRDNSSNLLSRLENLEKYIKKENNIFNNENENKEEYAWEIYYFLHSKFFSLDSAIKINQSNHYYYGIQIDDDNEGAEESFRIILCILFFLSQYYKYIVDNKDEFFYYQNIIKNAQFEDLKIVNKKCAFFSFFNESLDLLSKIFDNTTDNLVWFVAFEKELKRFLPSIEDKKIRKIPDFCPLYEEKKEEQKKGKKVKKEENEKEEETEKEEKVVKKEEKDKNLEKKFGLKKNMFTFGL